MRGSEPRAVRFGEDACPFFRRQRLSGAGRGGEAERFGGGFPGGDTRGNKQGRGYDIFIIGPELRARHREGTREQAGGFPAG